MRGEKTILSSTPNRSMRAAHDPAKTIGQEDLTSCTYAPPSLRYAASRRNREVEAVVAKVAAIRQEVTCSRAPGRSRTSTSYA